MDEFSPEHLPSLVPNTASCCIVSVVSEDCVCAFAFIVFHNKHCMYLMSVLCCACLQRLLTGWELVSSPIEAAPVSMEMRLLQTHRFLLSASCPLPTTSLPQSVSFIDERCYMILMHWHRENTETHGLKQCFRKYELPHYLHLNHLISATNTHKVIYDF